MLKYKEGIKGLAGFIRGKISFIVILSLISTIFYIVFQDVDLKSNKNVMPDEKDFIELKPVAPKAPKACVDTKSYIIETDDILKGGQFIALDLSTFENFKVKRIDNNRVGYYYRRTGAVKEFYTIFKNEPKETNSTK